VNGQRLQASWILQHGDIVECGSSFFIYRESEARGRARLEIGRQPGQDVVLSMPPLHYQVAAILPFASSDLSIHLHGETGAGKDVVARAIHDLSGRRGRFVARNCAAIPDNLFESELFGYKRGAFSGATSNKRGQVLEAHNGTLFLDEIGELSLPMQAKLLRVLELKEVLPIGATDPVPVDFRLVSATLCDLRAMVAEGKFRKDLYGRLGQTFLIPPLRDHKEYIGALLPVLLADTLLPEAHPIAGVRFTIAAARAIVRHTWPFNIRELKQCIQSALTAAWAARTTLGPLSIDLGHLPDSIVEAAGPDSSAGKAHDHRHARRLTPKRLKSSPSDAELVAALDYASGNRAEAARALGVSERTVFRRIRKLRPDESST
jgi:transcriptional regulator with PAS, ATPase and Fis domain